MCSCDANLSTPYMKDEQHIEDDFLTGGGRSTASRSNQNTNFYTDDSPGLKISPVCIASE